MSNQSSLNDAVALVMPPVREAVTDSSMRMVCAPSGHSCVVALAKGVFCGLTSPALAVPKAGSAVTVAGAAPTLKGEPGNGATATVPETVALAEPVSFAAP